MLEKIAAFIEEQLGTIAKEDITEETSFKDDLGADSLDLFELVMRCEEEYKIEIPSEDLENINTVGDMMNYIKAQGIDV
ncbi:MAG: acyl carrier protein [Lachnospiraceae bacterium]|nr:acyl carrier protein [Lachnospiraceae bacterium]